MYSITISEYYIKLSSENKLDKILSKIMLVIFLIILNAVIFFLLKKIVGAILQFSGPDYLVWIKSFTLVLSHAWVIFAMVTLLLFWNYGRSSSKEITVFTEKRSIRLKTDLIFWTIEKEIPYNQVKKVWIAKKKNDIYQAGLTIGNKNYIFSTDNHFQRLHNTCQKIAKKLDVSLEEKNEFI